MWCSTKSLFGLFHSPPEVFYSLTLKIFGLGLVWLRFEALWAHYSCLRLKMPTRSIYKIVSLYHFYKLSTTFLSNFTFLEFHKVPIRLSFFNGPFPASFSIFTSFLDRKTHFKNFIADVGIRTGDLWCRPNQSKT